MSDADDNAIPVLERSLNLPSGFYRSLLDATDWSFVVQLHALLEVATTELLSEVLEAAYEEYRPPNQPRVDLGSVFAHLPMSEKHFGKVAFLRALGLVDDGQVTFVRKLSELRNDLVHDVRNVIFTFDRHVASLDANQRRGFARTYSFSLKPTINVGIGTLTREEVVLASPKLAIWAGGHMCLRVAHVFRRSAALIKDAIANEKAARQDAMETSRLLSEMLGRRSVAPGSAGGGAGSAA